MKNKELIEQSYAAAKARYAALGVDTDAALKALEKMPISLHCWQGDDVTGFESEAGGAGGGTLCTGNYPGRARTAAELRADLEKAFALLPGKHRVNLHSLYAETNGKKVERNQLKVEHFANWIAWAKKNGVGLDFNPSFFSHPLAADGLTLSHPDEKIRKFWIEHGKCCRKISEAFGRELGTPSVMNIWIPDGFKDTPVDRKGIRERLAAALDEMLNEKIDEKYHLDAVECKLFGIGAESCTVGSHEFYMGYALKNNLLLCLDAGHFHPTEVISDKISSIMQFFPGLLLHVSRPVRWDSDHVVIFDDELQAIGQELVRGNYGERVHVGLDFFDATINRLAAWTVGARNMQKALCKALLEPAEELRKFENALDFTDRLVYLEELKSMPYSAVYDYFCLTHNAPVGLDYLKEIKDYEAAVQSKRD